MRTHHVRYVAERDEHGEIVGALSIGRDITEHKQAEALLVQREREFRSLAENLPDAIFRYDHAGRRIYVNPVVERLAGQPCKALVGKLPTEAALNPAIDSAKAQRYVMEVLETGERRVFETAFVAADGRQAFFHLVIVPEFAADGSVGGALGIGHDISPLKQMEDTLRERQAFLDSLLEAIPAPVFYQDRQGRYLGFNRAFGEFFGVSEEYLVGRSVFDICPRDIAEAYHAKDEELFAQGGVQRYESRVKSTQSELRDVVFHKATFAGTGNEAGGLIGVVLDISEHKRLEEALGLREQEFRSLAESSPDSIIRYDQKGHIRYLNSKLEHNLGRTLAELEGLQPCEAWPDGRFAEIEGAMWRAIREGEVTTVVLRAAINTPESRYQQIRVVPERDAAGRIVGALAFGSDVTEIFSLQAAIAAREQEFHSLAESYPDNIIRVDREHRIRYLNRAMARSMKLDDAGELLGKRHDEAFSDLRFQPIHEAEERAMTSGEEQVVELSVPLDDGSHAHHLLSVVPELDTAGKVIGAITVGRDITERKRMEEELRRTAAFQKQLLDGLRDVGIWQLVIEGGKIIYHNDTHLGAVLGYTAEDLDASPDFLDLVHPDDKPRVIERYRQHLAGDAAPGSFELGVLAKDGSRREFLIYSCVISDSNPPRALTLSMDITERKRMEDEVRLREQQFRALVENSPDTIARYDHNCRCIYANPALMASFAQWPNDLLGAMPSRFIGGESGLRYEEKIREILTNGVAADFELAWRQSGEVVHTLVRIAPEHGRDGKVLGVLAVGRDITELAEQREKIHNLAFFDFVTGLANRALFHDRLYHAIADARWHDTLLGVILLDLDRFKTVNDTLGHDVGDALLREAAARLSGCVRDYDTVARLGGDEFAILLPEIRDAQSLSTVADKILNELGKPFLLGGKEVFIGASIGIATYPSDCEDADGLLKFADLAMYAAKSAGGNGFRYYSAGLTVRAHERMKIETELRYALERGEFELYFQPKVRLADGCMTGSEALLRWNSPKFGMVTPDRFIGIAEDTGMIVGIGAWVLREACHAASAWNAAGGLPHKVAVNLSPRQFGDGGLERNVTQALKETGCRAEWIELEITESLLLNTTEEVRRMLETLRAGGFSIAIDDFGTGYSSLSYLTNLPIDVLKIDRSFVKDMLTNPDKAELVKAIIAMAGALRMNLVAEGVETEEQAQLLLKHGCAVGQGYLYGKPMPKCEVENYSPSETDHLRTEQHTIAESRARQPTATTRLT
jgi:diguanylate cyclase (GGDEF)-like protein/PAS domain S-box-containing protein